MKSEKKNKRLASLAQQEHERLGEVVSNAPGIVWEARGEPGATRTIKSVSEGDILRAIPDLMFLHSPDGVYLDYRAGERCDLLAPPEEFLGKNIRDVLPPELADEFSRLFRRAQATGETQVAEYQLPILGEERWFEARIVDNGGDILSIVRDITDQKKVEDAIKESEANYRSIFNAVNDAVFVHDIETGEIVDVNQAMLDMYGFDRDEARTLRLDILSSNVPPFTREAALGLLKKAVEGEPQVFEWRARDKAGRLFWVEVSLKRSVIQGKDRVLAVVRNITHRKQAEVALRESEERFRNMADTAPVMIWVSGADHLRAYFNKQWLDFTGRTMEEELGNGWAEGVYPNDYGRWFETYATAFDLRQPFTIEYRLRRADGEFRWVVDSGMARFSPDGEFLGYIGSCFDITQHKAAEEALEGLSGKLIRARENECARIARELHDDLNQRLALVSIELDQLRQDPPNKPDQLRTQLEDVMSQIAEISEEIHRMSYDLHPSKLIHLGLVAALKSLCEDLHRLHGLRIEFTSEEAPDDLPQEVSLCLYRVAQEGLSNIVRHSGAQEAKVELLGTGAEIRLRVSDSGLGFDVKSPRISEGLGLVSMRERLRLIGGRISIESSPSQGTVIDTRVPLARIGPGTKAASRPTERRAAGG